MNTTETSNSLITPQTLEKLQISRLSLDAEAFTNGAIQALELIAEEPDYQLLTTLVDAARKWRKSEDCPLDYIDFPEGNSAALNGVIVNGFFEAVVQTHALLLETMEMQP